MNVSYNQKAKFQEEVGTAPLSMLGEVLDWVSDNLVPEDVFDTSILETWAYENGFRRFE